MSRAPTLRTPRALGLGSALVAVLLGLAFLAVLLGDEHVGALNALRALAGLPGDPVAEIIVLELRLPRTLAAALVGAALGLSGALMQTVARNPLADPGVLGVNAGAALGATLVIVAFREAPAWALPFAGFAGAGSAAAIVYAAAWKDGLAPLRMVLVGVGVAALASAGVTLLSAFARIEDAQRALLWLTGSLYAADWRTVSALGASIVGPVAVAAALARRFDVLTLGDDHATAVGLGVNATRGLAIFVSVALAGGSVAAAGTIGFVGLMAPHAARRLVGPLHGAALPVTALCGAILLLAADLVGRMALAPVQLPAGLVTALIGGPFFLYLMWRRRNG
ncbi:iron ABC transporter permease [Methylopila sp. 73B]|uniref:FecCD family ABC transporter permease n=1 Tax=Methylopila sp. 73B TaxID=1120792 RepID=UPI00036E38EC|nr:iron ABC transporter permease [Methylopila sp. 73B]